MKRANFKNTEQAREIHAQCVEQVEIVKGIIAATRYRVDDADEGLDPNEVCDVYGALHGAYDASDKAWDKLSELGDLIPPPWEFETEGGAMSGPSQSDAETALNAIRAIFDALTAIDTDDHAPLDDTAHNLAETGLRLTKDALEAIQTPPTN